MNRWKNDRYSILTEFTFSIDNTAIERTIVRWYAYIIMYTVERPNTNILTDKIKINILHYRVKLPITIQHTELYLNDERLDRYSLCSTPLMSGLLKHHLNQVFKLYVYIGEIRPRRWNIPERAVFYSPKSFE